MHRFISQYNKKNTDTHKIYLPCVPVALHHTEWWQLHTCSACTQNASYQNTLFGSLTFHARSVRNGFPHGHYLSRLHLYLFNIITLYTYHVNSFLRYFFILIYVISSVQDTWFFLQKFNWSISRPHCHKSFRSYTL